MYGIHLLPTKLLNICGFTLFLLSSSAQAQTIGGGFEQLHQWRGEARFDMAGEVIASAGDVNGDGFDDILVGAPSASPNYMTNRGSVYVYSGADYSLLFQWNGSAIDDLFGSAVAGAGDVNADGYADIVIGASRSSAGGLLNAGGAIVRSGFDGSVIYRWGGQQANIAFGISVAGAGDMNGDGFDDIAVGATGTDHNGTPNAGSAFVFSGMDGTLMYQFNGPASNANLGSSLACAGDLNADGHDDIIVGALGTIIFGVSYDGSAFAYSGSDGSLLYRWDAFGIEDKFGYSVSSAGDVNADGFDDVIIGAYGVSPTAMYRAGGAYVFSGQSGALLHQWFGSASYNYFGQSVSGAGDVDGDGFPDLIVGAPNVEIAGAFSVGAAYLFSGESGALIHQWDGFAFDDRFGTSVAMVGDTNADGHADIVVSAPGRDIGYQDVGAINLYRFNPYLHMSSNTASASAGEVLNLEIEFPNAAAFQTYKVLISATGTGPTTYGIEIPLSQDSMVVDSFLGHYPVQTYANLHGVLSITGDASCSLTIPAGAPSSLVGRRFYFAVIANQVSQLPQNTSAAKTLLITP